MFCEKCGKELEDGVKFCEHCGAPIAEDAGKIMPANAHTEFSGQTTEKKDSCATIKKIILFALEICFFLPFCTISCSRYSVTITGLTATIGDSSNDIDPGIYPVLLFLLPLVALILIFKYQSDKTAEAERISDNFSLAAGILDLAVLLAFYLQITYEIKREIGSDRVSDVLSFKMGYLLEVILNIALVILYFYQKSSKEK